MYGDEAVAEVDKLIDQAIITGLHRIDIIHGKGTGALRKKITDYLKNNSSIKSFRLGEWNEGGTGVTVVELV
jgi:DNA mismatch repair protein MutS2